MTAGRPTRLQIRRDSAPILSLGSGSVCFCAADNPARRHVVHKMEGGQFCPQPAFSVDGRGRHQGQKPKVLGGGIYPARGFSPAPRKSTGCRVGFWRAGSGRLKGGCGQDWPPSKTNLTHYAISRPYVDGSGPKRYAVLYEKTATGYSAHIRDLSGCVAAAPQWKKLPNSCAKPFRCTWPACGKTETRSRNRAPSPSTLRQPEVFARTQRAPRAGDRRSAVAAGRSACATRPP